jgi:hypothetical protein
MPPPKPKAILAIAATPAPDKGKIIVPVPNGLDLEGKKPGETLDTVCEFEVEPDGKSLCLKKVNGIVMDGYGDKDEPDEDDQTAPDSSFAGSVTGQPAEEA